jgi:hypothetical protein
MTAAAACSGDLRRMTTAAPSKCGSLTVSVYDPSGSRTPYFSRSSVIGHDVLACLRLAAFLFAILCR